MQAVGSGFLAESNVGPARFVEDVGVNHKFAAVSEDLCPVGMEAR